jgi:predicted outer membrane repeat protein
VTNTNDSGAGSLRYALAVANDGDTITFSASGSIVLTTGELLVDKSIAISGPRARNLVLDGNGSSRVFHIAPERTVTLSNLIIRNGSANANDGGGIYNDQAVLTLNDCTVTGNAADYGGAIYNNGFAGSATLEINNSNIHDNTAAHTGGGIYNDGGESGSASLTINNSTISNNSARLGGSIYNDGFDYGSAFLTIDNSTCSSNSADFGGCIFNDSSAGNASFTLNQTTSGGNTVREAGGAIYNDMVNGFGTQTVDGSTFDSNSAGTSGGAMYNDQGVYFAIHSCTFSRNSAEKDGGAMYNDGSQGVARLTIDSSTFDTNSAAVGGGIYNSGSQQGDTDLRILNTTFSTNTASYGGGVASNGVDTYYVRVTINNSTFSDNSASAAGGGIYSVAHNAADSALLTIANTILNDGSSGGNIYCYSGMVWSLGYNLANDDCGNLLTAPGDQTNTNPMLGPLQRNNGSTFTHALLPGSPAINAGDPDFAPPPLYDQRGTSFHRVMNGRVDIGAFEVQDSRPGQTPRPIPPHRPRPAELPRPTPR